jgi:hypothetical protein
MKRFAPLLFIVLALAAVPAAAADTQTPAKPQGHPVARIRLELLRVRLQLVRLEYRIACHDTSSDRCAQFTQKVVDRLTTLDGNVQKKLTELSCSSDSTDKRCAVLTKLDEKLQSILQKLQAPASSTDESGSDDAAATLQP